MVQRTNVKRPIAACKLHPCSAEYRFSRCCITDPISVRTTHMAVGGARKRAWDDEPFHKWLDRRRRDLGLTQDEMRLRIISPRTGRPVTQGVVSQWLADDPSKRITPGHDKLRPISVALSTDFEEVEARWYLQTERNNADRRTGHVRSESDDELADSIRETRDWAESVAKALPAVLARLDQFDAALRRRES